MAGRKGNGKRGRGRGGHRQGDTSTNGSGRAQFRGWGRGGGGTRGMPWSGSYLMDEALDFNIQMYADGV